MNSPLDKDKNGPRLPVRSGDEVLLILLVPVFAVSLGVALYAIAPWQPSDSEEKALKFIGEELILTLLLFCMLVLIRCVISPKWLEDALVSTGMKVMVPLALVSCALAALLLLAVLFHVFN